MKIGLCDERNEDKTGVGRLRCVAIVMFVLASDTLAQDWPQFFGRNRNGIYDGPALADDWDGEGPPLIWSQSVGEGFSGPVVADGRLILFHRLSNREVVEAFDPLTGESLWQYDYPTTYRDDFGFEEGPRAVPVIVDGVVYTFGAQGQLHAVRLDTGEGVWSVDTMQRFNVSKGFFGAGGSPLVEDGRVIANIGGEDARIVAFDAATGEVLWTATDHGASYSSAVGATIAGQRLAIFHTRAGLVALDPETGDVQFDRFWRSPSASSVNAASPMVIDDRIFISAEYGPGAGALEWDGSELSELWASNDVLTNHYATSVYHDGYLYGYHGRQEFGPSLRAVAFETGRVMWNIDQFRAGGVILAGDRLLILRESGESVLADASPDTFRTGRRSFHRPCGPMPRCRTASCYVRNSDRRDTTLVALDLRP